MASVNPKLIILSEQFEGQKIHELSDQMYSIGRIEERSICIPDTTVSTNHCELVRNEDGSYRVVDLGSSNGTRINGVLITEQSLNHSDMLQVGGIEILYHSDDEDHGEGQNATTGINLEDTAGGLQIQDLGNVDPFKKGNKKGNSKIVKIVLTATFSILGLIVLLFLGKLILKMF